MNVKGILNHKGADVATITPDVTVATAIGELARHGVGALVVSRDGSTITGILSERDIVRALDEHGADLVGRPVEEIMVRDVVTCRLADRLETIMAVMTERRFRHLPVVEDGVLAGIISIGDVVKRRLDELETETEQMTDYIRGRA